MNSAVRKFALSIGFALIALFLIGFSGVVWGGLLYANFRTTSSIPWALPVLLVYLWLLWRYLAGFGWPYSTSSQRAALLRAYAVSPAAYGWSMTAGLLAVFALAGLWIVMFRLYPMEPNPLIPTSFTSSPIFVAAIVVGAALLAPISEESAVRGYLQSILERNLAPLRRCYCLLLSSPSPMQRKAWCGRNCFSIFWSGSHSAAWRISINPSCQ
jgi:membrane protease YdiL (CAAX protease family)